MENAEITALAVVAFIAVLEICCFFICSRLRGKSYPLCTVLPIFAEDDELERRLEYIGTLIEDGSSCVETLILLDCGGSDGQIELCREFCSHFRSAELLAQEDIEDAMRRFIHLS
ncbi:hypothetical protein [Ruminococcus flavefaciens]|uniref:Glycosyltransferase 2-like domain-containing protein n=1 Tax=Ruminococcus flavefaciens 007c TaxID=1341157 RepID=W7UGI5_RUMFL|nr:hypothetical protein [Ruminococcus flavefaciens]EWM54281.1 hypothetical protein RF007C_11770 [Ruminococcus flavefaciens 007c]